GIDRHPALQRGYYVLGVESAAVVKCHAFAQRDFIGEAIFGKGRHVGGEQRHGLPLGVIGVKRLENVLVDGQHDIGRRLHDVERRRLADGGGGQGSIVRLGQSQAAGAGKCCQRHQNECTFPHFHPLVVLGG